MRRGHASRHVPFAALRVTGRRGFCARGVSPASLGSRRTVPGRGSFPMSAPFDEARRLLRLHFGYPDFRPAQAPVIRSVLAGRDTLAVLPTGGGKSVCFQIPALVIGGLTLVV